MMKIGLVGLGYWGPNLLRNFLAIPDLDIIICDKNPLILDKFLKKHKGLSGTLDVDELLCDPTIQGIVLATPVDSHFVLGKKVLEQGKHLFVEKPLTANLKEAQILFDLAETKKVALLTGHIFLFSPTIQYAKKMLENNELGELLYMHSIRTNLGPIRKDIDVLWDLAPHDVSIFNYWMGSYPEKVSAHGHSLLAHKKNDLIYCTFQYGNNVSAHCHCSWVTPKKIRQIMLVGSKKLLIIDDMNLQEPLRIHNKGIGSEALWDMDYVQYLSSQGDGDVFIPKIQLNEPLAQECLSFIERIKGGPKSLVEGHCGLDVVKCLVAAGKSIDLGGGIVELASAMVSEY